MCRCSEVLPFAPFLFFRELSQCREIGIVRMQIQKALSDEQANRGSRSRFPVKVPDLLPDVPNDRGQLEQRK